MDPQALTSLISESGLGVASFVVLCYFGYKILGAADLLLTNHLAHFQGSLDTLVQNSAQANEMLKDILKNTEKRNPDNDR